MPLPVYSQYTHVPRILWQVLSGFEAGKLNLLVCTSVAEEGMNVRTCNFGLLMDSCYTGKTLAQCKGRVRAPNGTFHVFYMEGSPESTGLRRSEQQMHVLETTLADR